jgi:hypothetical protein
LVKPAPLSIAYRLRCLECLRRSWVECLFLPNKTWKELSRASPAGCVSQTGLDEGW